MNLPNTRDHLGTSLQWDTADGIIVSVIENKRLQCFYTPMILLCNTKTQMQWIQLLLTATAA